MQLLSNREAIATFNSVAPTEWPRRFTKERRLRLLREKAEALKDSPLTALFPKLPNARAKLTRPYPRLPAWIYRTCAVPVVVVLNEILGQTNRQIIQQILDERLPGERFGTDWSEGRWRVVAPPSQNRLFDLMGLSHELGHILAKETRRSDFAAQVRGEALALSLEALAVASQLSQSEHKSWLHYCLETDEYNFEFFRREFSEDLEPLLHPAFIFRESLWTSHGYQAIYAAASLVRQTILKNFFRVQL
jgi:hypothetical protein